VLACNEFLEQKAEAANGTRWRPFLCHPPLPKGAHVNWKFQINAEEHRLFSRILQVLESQTVSIVQVVAPASGGGARVHFEVSSANKTNRIEALLYRLGGVRSVAVVPLNIGSEPP
jgi:hypothetical protein